MDLPQRAGSVLAAIATLDAPGAQDLVEWLDATPGVWVPPSDPHEKDAQSARENRHGHVAQAVGDLRRRLEEELPQGMQTYRIPRGRYTIGPIDVRLSARAPGS